MFLGQLFLYIWGNPTQSLSLSRSTSIPLVPLEPPPKSKKYNHAAYLDEVGRIPLKIHVTFPHVPCKNLDVTHNGASLLGGELDRHHGRQVVSLRKPTSNELRSAWRSFAM